MLFEASGETKKFENVQNEQINVKDNPVARVQQKEQGLKPVAHFVSCFEMLEYNLDNTQDCINSGTAVQLEPLFEAVDKYLRSYDTYRGLKESGEWNGQLEQILSQIESSPPNIDDGRIEHFYKISKSIENSGEERILEIIQIIRQTNTIEKDFFDAKKAVEKGEIDEEILEKTNQYLQNIKRIQGFDEDVKLIICHFGFDADSPTIDQFRQEAEDILN